MTRDNELINDLLKNYKKPEDLIGEKGLLKQLTKQLLERAMAAELTEHVGYEKHDPAGNNSGNSRNGKSAKTIKGSFGRMPLAVPRVVCAGLPALCSQMRKAKRRRAGALQISAVRFMEYSECCLSHCVDLPSWHVTGITDSSTRI